MKSSGRNNVVAVGDVLQDLAEHRQRLIENPVWGKWTLHRETFCLVYKGNAGEWYEIELSTFTDSAAILDWIYQVTSKTWMPARGITDLLKAINDIFYPQENYCSWGQDRKRDPMEVAQWIFGD